MKQITKTILIFFILTLTSCRGKVVFSDYVSLPNSQWSKDKSYSFNVNIPDSSKTYELSLLIRNNDSFEKQNLWLSITQEHNGKIKTDTVNIFLLDENGKWRGSGIRNTYDNNLIWRSSYRFSQTGNHIFLFKHLMRSDTLQGIERIGIEVTEKQ